MMPLESILVCGKEHATIVYDVPIPKLYVLRLKNYHLIFAGIEYVLTASVAVLPRFYLPPNLDDPSNFDDFMRQKTDQILSGEGLTKVYAYENEYDDIVQTFRSHRRKSLRLAS
jgi:hypothetical protein